MGKHLIWITAFLALAFAGDRLVGYFLKEITDNSQFRYSRLYNSNETADILFVGNSRGLNFYQPEAERVTGQKTMNLSYNGMPADLAKCLVMDYLDRHIAPKIMVVDVTLCDRYNESLKASMNLYTPYSKRLADLLKNSVSLNLISPKNSVAVDTTDIYAGRKVFYGGQLSHLYRYNSEIFQRVLYHRNRTDNDWIVDRVIGSSAASDTALRSYQVRMFPVMVEHLKEMIAYAKEKGVNVKLVINPYFPAFAESIRDSFLTPLKMYVESQTGMPVSDFSTALHNIDEIGDYQHANKKGSIRYMNVLSENGIFNILNNSALGNINGNSNRGTSSNPSSDIFIDFTSNALPTKAQKVSTVQQVDPASFSNENVSPHEPASLIPFSVLLSKKKQAAKKRKPKYDFGFSVDTVGLGQ